MRRKKGLIAAVLVAMIAISGCGEVIQEENLGYSDGAEVEVELTEETPTQQSVVSVIATSPRDLVEQYVVDLFSGTLDSKSGYFANGMELDGVEDYLGMIQTAVSLKRYIRVNMDDLGYNESTKEAILEKSVEKFVGRCQYDFLSCEQDTENESHYTVDMSVNTPMEFEIYKVKDSAGKYVKFANSINSYEASEDGFEKCVGEMVEKMPLDTAVLSFFVVKDGVEWKIQDIDIKNIPTYGIFGQDEYSLGSAYITSSLDEFSQREVRLFLNTMYAYHGYTFTEEDNKEFFSKKTWYQPIGKSIEECEAEFNECENANKETIIEYEKIRGWRPRY